MAIACGIGTQSPAVGWGIAILVVVAAIAVSRPPAIYNKNVLPGLRDEWNKKFVCLRCGEVFKKSS